jgi:hypothetical protein
VRPRDALIVAGMAVALWLLFLALVVLRWPSE